MAYELISVEIWILGNDDTGEIVGKDSYVAVRKGGSENENWKYLDKMGVEQEQCEGEAASLESEEDGIARVINWLTRKRIEIRKGKV